MTIKIAPFFLCLIFLFPLVGRCEWETARIVGFTNVDGVVKLVVRSDYEINECRLTEDKRREKSLVYLLENDLGKKASSPQYSELTLNLSDFKDKYDYVWIRSHGVSISVSP